MWCMPSSHKNSRLELAQSSTLDLFPTFSFSSQTYPMFDSSLVNSSPTRDKLQLRPGHGRSGGCVWGGAQLASSIWWNDFEALSPLCTMASK
jgi:hypothetical protein